MQLSRLYDTPRKRGFLGLLFIIIVIVLSFLALSQPSIELGDEAVFHFTIGLADGTVIGTTDINEAKLANIYDSTLAYEPVDLIVGTGAVSSLGVLPIEVEEALLGMVTGDQKVITVHAPYGYYDARKVTKIPIDDFRNYTGREPVVSSEYVLLGKNIYGKVADIQEGIVYVDINHMYAVPLSYLKKVPLEEIQKLNITPRKGMQISYEGTQAYIFDVSETEVGLDFYPPFLFKVKVISIRKNVV